MPQLPFDNESPHGQRLPIAVLMPELWIEAPFAFVCKASSSSKSAGTELFEVYGTQAHSACTCSGTQSSADSTFGTTATGNGLRAPTEGWSC